MWKFLIIFFVSQSSFSKEEVIYKYQKNQKVDLGNLEIKGDIIAPSDISISVEDRREFQRKLFNRKSYEYEIRNKVLNLR